MYEFKQDLHKIMENDNVNYIEINCDSKEAYYKLIDELVEFNKNAITVNGTSKEQYNIILEKTEDADAEEEEPASESDNK